MTANHSAEQKGNEPSEAPTDDDSLAVSLSDGSENALVARVEGLAGTHLQRREAAIRESAEEAGCELYTLGGVSRADEQNRFRDVVRSYVSNLADVGELSDTARRLFEFLFQRSRGSDPVDLDSKTYRNSLCRLWVELTRQSPAVLLISHPRSLPDAQQQVVRQLIEYYYLDPIDELFSGKLEGAAPRGGVIWLEQPGAGDPWFDDERVVELESGECAESSVRSFLDREEVVDRLVEATEGDPQRLEALVEALPSDTASIWKMRLRELDEAERRLVALLGAAGGDLPVDWFEAAGRKLLEHTAVNRSIQRLVDAGFMDKNIVGGELKLALFDEQLGEVALRGFDESTRKSIFGALADGIESLNSSEPDDAFMADVLIRAGRLEKGSRLGLKAARRLYAETSLQQAQAWFERVLDVADAPAVQREILEYLVEIYADTGHIEAAFDGLERLSELTDHVSERIESELDVAEKLIRSGDAGAALDRIESVRESLSDPDSLVERRLNLVQAKGLSNRGEGDRAREMLREVVRGIPESGDAGSFDIDRRDERVDRTLVEARNELANLAMFDGEYDRAEELYEENADLATYHGWGEEQERAEINQAVLEIQRGHYEEALEVIERHLSASPMPMGLKRAKLSMNAATCLERLGEFERAIGFYRESLRQSRRIDDAITFGFGAFNLASLLQRMGALDAAERLLERIRGEESGVPDYEILKWYPTARYCIILSEKGEYERAVELFETLPDDLDEGRVGWIGRRLQYKVARAYLGMGEPEGAEEILEATEPEPDDEERNLALQDIVRAGIALMRGDSETARSRVDDHVETLWSDGFFWSAAFATKIEVEALLASDNDQEAVDAIEYAVTSLAEEFGQIPDRYREQFLEVPIHEWLIQTARELGADVPSRLARYAERLEQAGEGEGAALEADDTERLRGKFPQIVGRDDSLMEIFRRVDQVAGSDAPVLIEGESGTGKELVADAVHRQSDRGQAPFVKVNCGAFVDELLLSEFFGHEKGAFTGAVEQKKGRFEQADGGTIFLDEVGDISPKAQVALLRVLQSGEFERVGGTETKDVDVRLVCATNRSLESLVDAGEFRLDLYYRLKGIVLELPALRERRSDIPLLIEHFSGRFGDEGVSFSKRALKFLASYSWPGNVRELKNLVRTVLLFAEDDVVDLRDVKEFEDFFSEGEFLETPPDIDFDAALEKVPRNHDGGSTSSGRGDSPERSDKANDADNTGEADPERAIVEELIHGESSLNDLKVRLERQSIERALRETDGNITRAAELLDMTRPRLSQIVNGDEELLALKEQLVS